MIRSGWPGSLAWEEETEQEHSELAPGQCRAHLFALRRCSCAA
jgi:hypothetical protein